MVTQGHLQMQQQERLQEEKPRKKKGRKKRRQRKDRVSAHLVRQHKVAFDGGQKAAKGAYDVLDPSGSRRLRSPRGVPRTRKK